MGELLVLKSTLHNNIPSPFTAEAFTCLGGIKLGITMGIQSVIIMGDSRTVIKKCQMSSTDKSEIGAIIKNIQNKNSCFQEIIFKHIHRSGNWKTHRFANAHSKRRDPLPGRRGGESAPFSLEGKMGTKARLKERMKNLISKNG